MPHRDHHRAILKDACIAILFLLCVYLWAHTYRPTLLGAESISQRFSKYLHPLHNAHHHYLQEQ